MATPATNAYGQALPPGWEAKYDPGQRRYFYINHSTQTTSWEDPRPAYYRQLQQQQQQQNAHFARLQPSPRPSPQVSHHSALPHSSPHPAPQRSPRPAHTPQPARSAGVSTETIPMKDIPKPQWQKDVEDKYNLRVTTLQVEDDEEDTASSAATSHTASPRPASTRTEETSFSCSIQVYEEKVQKLRTMFPTADETIIKQFLVKNHNNESTTITDLQQAGFQRQDAASVQLMVNRIKREFPAAEAGIIRDILHGVSNVESKARQELKSLGYQQAATTTSATTRSTGSLRGTLSTRGASPSSRNVTPATSTKKKSEPRVATPKEVSISDRKKLKAKIAAEFPDQSASTIEMACDVCHFDEGRVRTLIQSMATTQQAKNIVSRMGLSVDSEGRRSPSARSPRQPSPVPSNSTSTAPTFVFNFPDSNVSSSISTAFSSVASTSAFSSHRAGTSSGLTSKSMISSAASRPARSRPSGGSQPVSRPPPPVYSRDYGNYCSANLSQPQGPNTELANGPDRSILIEDYMANQGPDESLISGPDPDLMSGPTTPISGPDSDLSLGANPAIVSGPDSCLVSGPIRRDNTASGAPVLRGGVCNTFMNTFCWTMTGRWGSTSV